MANIRKHKKKKKTKCCPDCKGTEVCRTCHGRGIVKIINGRAKGGTFERKIAKDLTKWCGIHFTRSPLSGGWAKTGDITPKDPKEMVAFPFSIECKNQEIFSTVMLVESAVKNELSKTITGWWKQCTDDAARAKKTPLLVMTKAREPVHVLMWRDHFKVMDLMKHATVVFRIGDLRVMLWEEFLKMPYDEAKKAVNK